MNRKLSLTLALGLAQASRILAQDSSAAAPATTEAAAAPAAPAGPVDPMFESRPAKVSYGIGLQFGGQLRQQGIEVVSEALLRGINDAMTEAKPALDPEVLNNALNEYLAEIQTKRAEEAKIQGEKNIEEGKKFLEENKAKPTVKSTASGLQYEVVTEGTGKQPKKEDTVTVNYRGTLVNGTEFDSSYKRGEPAKFPVDRVIPGWTEALQLMKEGSKYKLFIPSDLAYGDRGAPPKIAPNSVLVFEVELIKVEDAAANPPPATPEGHGPNDGHNH